MDSAASPPTVPLHPVLVRQARSVGLSLPAEGPVAELLARVSLAYADGDAERYTNERTLAMVSREMQMLYDELRRSSEAIHGATIEASDDGIIVLDPNRKIVAMNKRFGDVWRLPEHVLRARDVDEMFKLTSALVTEPDVFAASTTWARENPSLTCADRVSLKDGRVIERRTAPIVDAADTIVGRVWFVRDVTERENHEMALRRAKELADDANAAKSRFLANMSHELRTPLNSILGFADVLGNDEGLRPDQREFVSWILQSGHHMLDLINDLLDLRRLEDKGTTMTLEPMSIRPAVYAAVDMVRPLVTERRQRLSVEVDADTTPIVFADRRAVIQVLVNLLSNAGKFTPEGGAIHVRASAMDDGRVEVSVIDNGIGISPADTARLFTYYTQVEGKTGHGFKGSGIGLALTRALVHGLGGEISVDSEVGKGSTFRFTLRRA
jgi:PAS domain S-box-containing protein